MHKTLHKSETDSFVAVDPLVIGTTYLHWYIPNLYSEAMELAFGGSPIACVLIECKTKHSGKWEQQKHRTSLDQLHIQHKATVID